MSAAVVPFVKRVKSPYAVPVDEMHFELPPDGMQQVEILSEVFRVNSDLLGIAKRADYFERVRMFSHPRFPGRVLVDIDLPPNPASVRGLFCVNPLTKRLEKLLDTPLVHFV